MVSNKILLAFLCLAVAVTGCSTGSGPGGDVSQTTCMVVGGLLGGAAGGVAANQNHNKDTNGRWAAGAGIGVAAGAGLGAALCAPPRTPPTVRASANPASGTAPLSTELRAVGEDDGSIVKYIWDLGDGTTAQGARVSHIYRAPGNYTARVSVEDNHGLTGMGMVPISVAQAAAPPPPPPPPTARKIVLRGVNFDFDKADIRADAQVILDAAVDILKENPGVRVQVVGHTDSVGTEEYNLGLSVRRADSVRDYLVSHGISASRLSAAGLGESEPVASNSTPDGRAQNRRVELNVR